MGKMEQSLTQDAITDLLIDSDLTRGLSIPEVKLLARYMGLNECAVGDVVFKEGDRGAFLCVVGSGLVMVKKSNLDQKTVQLAKLGKGRSFGEMALLDGEWRSATCIVVESATLLTLSQDSIQQMIEEAPKLAARVMRALAISLSRRLRMADGKLVDVG